MFIWNHSTVTSCFFAYLRESHPKTLLSHLGRIAAWTRMTKKGMGDVTEERGGRKEEMKKTRKKESGDNIFCINLNVYQVR